MRSPVYYTLQPCGDNKLPHVGGYCALKLGGQLGLHCVCRGLVYISASFSEIRKMIMFLDMLENAGFLRFCASCFGGVDSSS